MTLSGNTALTSTTSSFPGSYFCVARESIRASTGYVPNVGVFGRPAYNVLLSHPDITTHAMGQDAYSRLAGLVDVPVRNCLIADARIVASNENQTNTFGDCWSSFIFACYVEPNPGPLTATFAAQMRWRGFSSNGGPPQIELVSGTDTEKSVSYVRGRYYSDEKVLQPELGYLILSGV